MLDYSNSVLLLRAEYRFETRRGLDLSLKFLFRFNCLHLSHGRYEWLPIYFIHDCDVMDCNSLQVGEALKNQWKSGKKTSDEYSQQRIHVSSTGNVLYLPYLDSTGAD